MTNQTEFKAGVTGKARNWVGVIRRGKKIVWRCPHVHNNRDQYSRSNGASAFNCATTALGRMKTERKTDGANSNHLLGSVDNED